MPKRHHFALQKPTFFSAATFLAASFEALQGGRGSARDRRARQQRKQAPDWVPVFFVGADDGTFAPLSAALPQTLEECLVGSTPPLAKGKLGILLRRHHTYCKF